MDENEFRREFVPLFTFQCSTELAFFSEAIGKKPRKHNGEVSVGIKRKEATFCIAILGKADVRRKYYHVRIKLLTLKRIRSCCSQLSNAIHSVKDSDWQKGRCTLTFSRGPLQQLVLSEVTMFSSLAECASFLKRITYDKLTVKGAQQHVLSYQSCEYNLHLFSDRVLTE